jgi:hypothetical protein
MILRDLIYSNRLKQIFSKLALIPLHWEIRAAANRKLSEIFFKKRGYGGF